MKWTICTFKAHQQHKDEPGNKQQRGKAPWDMSNKWSVNEWRDGKEGATPIKVQERAHTPQWPELNTVET